MKWLILLCILSQCARDLIFAQPTMTVLRYERIYDDSTGSDKSNETIRISFAGDFTRIDYHISEIENYTIITHPDSLDWLLRTKMADEEKYFLLSSGDAYFRQLADSAFLYRKTSRKILNYKCQKAEVYGEGKSTVYWYAPKRKFRFNYSMIFPDILPGLPLEFYSSQQHFKLSSEKRNVPIPPNHFAIRKQ